MRNTRLVMGGFLLIALFFINGCGKTKEPVELLSFHAFHPDYNREDIAVYVDWRNQSEQKKIDGVILEIVCNEDYNQTFQCYLLEPEEVLPDAHNQENIIMLNQSELPEFEIYSLTASILQVNFTDGSIWESDERSTPLLAKVDGDKGDGLFPVRLNESLFFEGYENPDISDPIYFQADWTNASKEESILAVDYQITAKTSDGSIIFDEEGNDRLYISEYYKDASDWIPPGQNNDIVTHKIYNYEFVKACRSEGAAIYEITISRVVDSKGIVWENPDQDDKIISVSCGKKGYAFGRDVSNASVAELTGLIAERDEQYGLNLEEPQVFIKEQDYCVLRYENVDIRVELSDTNEVLPDKVAFLFYSTYSQEDFESYVQSCLDQICALRLCICPAVLTDRPYEELMEMLKGYNEDHDTYLDCNDLPGGVFGQVINLLDVNSNVMHCTIIEVGRDLYDPFENLIWVRENPWMDNLSEGIE